jgi:squalene monooxygenase
MAYAPSKKTDENLKWLQKACFGYFKLGGRCASTPVGLLAGLIQEPFTLIGHFFAVAFYATWLILTSKSILLLPLSMWRAFMVLWTAMAVIGPLILAELRG